MTVFIAITGGIGAGKSTFSNEVKKRKLNILDSDKQVDTLYKKPKKSFLNYLKKIGLGEAVKNNKINKKQIGNIIFSNKKIKASLEKYIFKQVRKKRAEFIKKEKKKKTKVVFLDIPLLFENNLSKDFDMVISIISKKKERLKRLRKSKKITKSYFDKIIATQTTDVVRIKNSDIIIFNNTTMRSYIIKINNVLNKIVR